MRASDTSEHIVLESDVSDVRQVPDSRGPRKVHASIAFGSRLRRRFLQLEIIDNYYLAVRSHSRTAKLEYVLDLRFVGMPYVSRHVSWRWITASASLLLITLALGFVRFGPPHWFHRHGLIICAAAAGAWAVATMVAVYRTTETVRLSSTDGAARLLEYTGGLGMLRDMQRFIVKITAHVRLAAAARRSTKAAHLRDAMREHQRLRELGVLSEPAYESAKARILGGHSARRAS